MPSPASELIAQILNPHGASTQPPDVQSPKAPTGEAASAIISRILNPQPAPVAPASSFPILEAEDPAILVV